MSRLGKIPIKIPDKVEVKITDDFIIVKGPRGELKQKLNSEVKIDLTDKELKVKVQNPTDRKNKALWGLFWRLINNMITGVTVGYEKKLEIIGVGFKASTSGNKLILNLGFSHPVEFLIPEGINIKTEGNFIIITGVDKQLVGETAARVRKLKAPEPYKGKGIKYFDEIIRRKEGKTAVKGK